MSSKKWARAKLYIGTKTAALASETAWTQIKGARIASGAFGKKWGTTDAGTFEDGYKRDAKTVFDTGSVSITGKRIMADPGQIALKAANDDKGDDPYNFRWVLDDDPGGSGSSPTTIKFRAQVIDFSFNGANPNNLVDFKSDLNLEDEIIEADAVPGA